MEPGSKEKWKRLIIFFEGIELHNYCLEGVGIVQYASHPDGPGSIPGVPRKKDLVTALLRGLLMSIRPIYYWLVAS